MIPLRWRGGKVAEGTAVAPMTGMQIHHAARRER
jgi:hypothetical protein